MSDPVQLLGQIDADCRALDAAGKELGAKLKLLAEAEIAYGDAMDAALVSVEADYEDRGLKLPGEAQREAHARRIVGAELRGRLRRLEREVEALKVWGRLKSATLSGRQSELAFLKAEGSAPQPQWSAAAA